MMDLGNGVYLRGNNMVFDVPKMLEAVKQPVTKLNCDSVAESLRAVAPLAWPEFSIAILKDKTNG